ncbi:hypothetical protein HZH68_007074 [Vespula germanica]|uniref:Uncharacterized protein n=1 Tax=Vespula germanica TaxID=30212 RepID=A0A834NAR8_VESGE|nr:hypothetical protein HZH68_007074 [Vespula germanica]
MAFRARNDARSFAETSSKKVYTEKIRRCGSFVVEVSADNRKVSIYDKTNLSQVGKAARVSGVRETKRSGELSDYEADWPPRDETAAFILSTAARDGTSAQGGFSYLFVFVAVPTAALRVWPYATMDLSVHVP